MFTNHAKSYAERMHLCDNAGYEAARTGITKNPHEPNSQEGGYWTRGWNRYVEDNAPDLVSARHESTFDPTELHILLLALTAYGMLVPEASSADHKRVSTLKQKLAKIVANNS